MGTTRTFFRAATAAGFALVLSGCSNLSHTLGLEKQPPDEFTVVQSPPLVMPPDFGLRPPASPSQKPAETPVEEQARQTVFRLNDSAATPLGAPSTTDNGLTPGENALLAQAGASNANPAIRDQVDAETAASPDETFADKLLFWKTPQKPDETLDASAEAKRLQQNAALGQPVTNGATPVIQRTQRTIFNTIF